MTIFPKSVCLSLGSLFAVSAFAHHGFGSFDLKTEIELSGTVTGLDWVNPHAWLYLDVAGSEGEVVPFRCEMRAATVLRRSGWTPEMFPLGEQVTIRGAPDRRDAQACYVSTIVFPDGSTIDRYGQRTEPAPVEDLSKRPPRLANGTPNISGDWAPEQYVMTDPQGRAGALVPLSVAEGGDDAAQTTGSPWATASVQYTALGEQAAAGFDLRSSDNPRMRCEITSIIFDWDFDGPINRIAQHDDRIVLQYGRHGFARTIHMDMDAHPADIEPSRSGHSIGRWEGDTLVVDTIGFAPGIIAPPVFHGEKLHVIERFTIDTETWTLTREYVATDPDYFTDAYVGSDTLKVADAPYGVDECKELGFVEDGGQTGRTRIEAASPDGESASKPWWKFWE